MSFPETNNIKLYSPNNNNNNNMSDTEDELISVRSNKDTEALRQSYLVAKTRASELSQLASVNILSSSHSVKGVKVYTAIASLLNTSISLNAIDNLEKYIKKTASQLPLSIIDLQDWNVILEIAKEKRSMINNKKYEIILKQQKNDYKFIGKFVIDATKICRNELNEMKNEINSDVNNMKNNLIQLYNIMPIVSNRILNVEKENNELKINLKNTKEILKNTENNLNIMTNNYNISQENLKNTKEILENTKLNLKNTEELLQQTQQALKAMTKSYNVSQENLKNTQLELSQTIINYNDDKNKFNKENLKNEKIIAQLDASVLQLESFLSQKSDQVDNLIQTKVNLESDKTKLARNLSFVNKELNKHVQEEEMLSIELEKHKKEEEELTKELEQKKNDEKLLALQLEKTKKEEELLSYELAQHKKEEEHLGVLHHADIELLETTQLLLRESENKIITIEKNLKQQIEQITKEYQTTEKQLQIEIKSLKVNELKLQENEKQLKISNNEISAQITALKKKYEASNMQLHAMKNNLNILTIQNEKLQLKNNKYEKQIMSLNQNIKNNSGNNSLIEIVEVIPNVINLDNTDGNSISDSVESLMTIETNENKSTSPALSPTTKIIKNLAQNLANTYTNETIIVVEKLNGIDSNSSNNNNNNNNNNIVPIETESTKVRTKSIKSISTQIIAATKFSAISSKESEITDVQKNINVDVPLISISNNNNNNNNNNKILDENSLGFESARKPINDINLMIKDMAADYIEFIKLCVVDKVLNDISLNNNDTNNNNSNNKTPDDINATSNIELQPITSADISLVDKYVIIDNMQNVIIKNNTNNILNGSALDDELSITSDIQKLNNNINNNDAIDNNENNDNNNEINENNVIMVDSNINFDSNLDSNITTNNVGIITLPTFTQYLEDAINRIYDKHEAALQSQSTLNLSASILSMLISNPAAEALRFLQDIRYDIEIMRSNILMSTVKQCEMNLPMEALSPLVMRDDNGITNTDIVINNSFHNLNEHNNTIDLQKRAGEVLLSIQDCVYSSKYNMDSIRSQCAINQNAIRSLNNMLSKFNMNTELSAIDVPAINNENLINNNNILENNNNILDNNNNNVITKKYQTAIHNEHDDNSHQLNYIEDDASSIGSGYLTQGGSLDSIENNKLQNSKFNINGGKSDIIFDPNKKPLPNNTINMKSLIKLQSIIRGFLGRRRVQNIRAINLAMNQGVLAATLNTKQGQTGWYSCQGMLFYFCLHNGEFILLCGPITDAIYLVACDELEAKINAFNSKLMSSNNSGNSNQLKQQSNLKLLNINRLDKDVCIDRLALQATRTQIQLLLDTVRNKDMEIDALRQELVTIQNHHMYDIEELSSRHQEQIEQLNIQLKESKSISSGYRQEIIQLRIQLTDINEKYHVLLTNNDHKSPRSIINSNTNENIKLSPRLALIDNNNNNNNNNNIKNNPNFINNLVKFQASVRGFIGRRKAHEKKVLKAASETGVLIALNKTEQGKSGWYQAPGGDVFYFVRDDHAEWLLAAGPISRNDYDTVVKLSDRNYISSLNCNNSNFNSNKINNNNVNITAGGSGASFALMKKAENNNKLNPAELLRKCTFELAVEHEDVKGDLYMANKSNKLYVAVSVDSLLLDSQYAYSSLENVSSLENDTIASSST